MASEQPQTPNKPASEDTDTWKIIAGVAIGFAVVGGLYLALKGSSGSSSSSGKDEEFGSDAQVVATPAKAPAKAPKPASKAGAAAAQRSAAAPAPAGEAKEGKAGGEKVTEAKPDPTPTAVVAASAAANAWDDVDLTTKTNWPEIGLSFEDLGSFKVTVDEENPGGLMFTHPLVVLRLEHAGKENGEPGPGVTILVEDITKEYMSCSEYCNKTKQLAVDPDLGFPMPPEMKPIITKDEAVKIGDYEYILEYEQMIPTGSPMMMVPKKLKFRNYITVRDGMAYVLQFTCELGDYARYVKECDELASGVSISPTLTHNSKAVTQVSNGDLKVRVEVPAFWTPAKPPTKGPIDEVACLALFDTNSEIKADTVIVGASGSLKGGELAEKLAAAKEGSEGPAEEGGVLKIESKNGNKQVLTYVKENVYLQVTAKGKNKVSSVPREVVDSIMDSISDEPNPSDLMVDCESLKCKFNRPVGSQLGAHRFGDPTLACNLTTPGKDHTPVFAISRPSPEPGKDAPTEVKEWMTRVDEEFSSSQGATITGKALKDINGIQCVSVDCKEMTPSPNMMGMEEHKSRMNVYVVEGSTVLVRMDCVTGEWPRVEHSFNSMSESVTFY